MVVIATVSCSDLYETHEKYLKMGEQTYIGKADSLQVNGGFNRVELKWKLNEDPKISKCLVTWNGNQQPVEVEAIPGASMSKIIDIEEGKYIFKIVVMSASGKESLAQTVSGESYGTEYQSRLTNKGVASIVSSEKRATITWKPLENCIGVNLVYTNRSGVEKTIFVEGDATSTLIEDFVSDSEFKVFSLFKPERDAIDTIASQPETFRFPSIYRYDRNAWNVLAVSDETASDGGGKDALIDDKLNTYWHSQWSPATMPLPHWAVIDMVSPKRIAMIETYRRAGNTNSKSVQYFVGPDADANAATWTKIGEATFSTGDKVEISIPNSSLTLTGRYLKLVLPDSNSEPHTSIAEVYVYGN